MTVVMMWLGPFVHAAQGPVKLFGGAHAHNSGPTFSHVCSLQSFLCGHRKQCTRTHGVSHLSCMKSTRILPPAELQTCEDASSGHNRPGI